MTAITYATDRPLDAAAYIDLLRRSTLSERRPVDDPAMIAAMVAHASLLVTAWAQERLVGVARTLTDFSYIAYLADLAVDAAWQRQGIGRGLLAATRARLGPRARLLLIAAPQAARYYPHVGFRPQPDCWILAQGEALR